MPALLKSTSNLPKDSLIVANNARTRSGRLTSVATTSNLPSDAWARAEVSFSCSIRRPASTTEYPAACNAKLAARPIPLPAPVTSAILPWDAISIHFKQAQKYRIWIDGRSLPPSLLGPELEDGEVQVRSLRTRIAG